MSEQATELAAQAAELVERLRRAPDDPEVLLAVARFEARSEQPLAVGDLAPPGAARPSLAELAVAHPELPALGRMLRAAALAAPEPASTVVWREPEGAWRLTLVQEGLEYRIPEPEAAPEAERLAVGWRTWRPAEQHWYTARRSTDFAEGVHASIPDHYVGCTKRVRDATFHEGHGAWELYATVDVGQGRSVDYSMTLGLRPSTGEFDLIQTLMYD